MTDTPHQSGPRPASPPGAGSSLPSQPSPPSPGDDVVIDWNRSERVGHPELVYGAGKTPDQVARIASAYAEAGRDLLVTRISDDHAQAITVSGDYDPVPERFYAGRQNHVQPHAGPVAVVSAGSSDAATVGECMTTCQLLGIQARAIQDVGVAGIHRLFARLDDIRAARVVIVVAGFEGALASVMAGLIPQPIIAVPAAVGYA